MITTNFFCGSLIYFFNCFSHIRDNVLNTETRDPNLFVYLTYQNNEGGTIGIAWVGVVCYSGKGYRVGISEYFNSDLRTAEVYHF